MATIPEKSLAVYKDRPARVMESGEKITIALSGGESIRVREKDITVIYPGPSELKSLEWKPEPDIHGVWELLEDTQVGIQEFAELLYSEWSARAAWGAYRILKDGLYFSGDIDAIQRRNPEEIASDEQKRSGKQREAAEREEFLERLRQGNIQIPDDARFVQDVEALAFGQSDKSRTLKELGKPETPLEAHKLLLKTGFWMPWINPYPARHGCSLSSAKTPVPHPPAEDRVDLTHLAAFAIDSEWSEDPDDAISIQGNTVWVHISDPAAAILPESPADKEARNRGATLYTPEGIARMLSDDSLVDFALGLQSPSPALSFKMTLSADGSIVDTEILRSWVNVSRITYAEADNRPDLAAFFEFAERNMERRRNNHAVMIQFPDVRIHVSGENVCVELIPDHASAEMVRECMLLAGEGAARWALDRKIPFPFIQQEVSEPPRTLLPGFAGAYQLRRTMHARILSTAPGFHEGLGIRCYTQVTSPLRRYIDLLAHQQIRAFLQKSPLISEEDMLMRINIAGIATSATVQAERDSNAHWTAVYLSGKKDSEWDAVVLEKRERGVLALIPELGLETFVGTRQDLEPNDSVILTLKSVKIPESELVFQL
ncbi:exoribonuclease II [Spirochaetia bacterium]|nr:exoribonuclease II [Spirochaetia bacterium]